MDISLESLGITKEELRDRVVEAMCDKLAQSFETDDGSAESRIIGQLTQKVREQIDEAVDKLATTHVLPLVAGMVEKVALTPTNKWGEKSGPTMTFSEYLVARFEAWMNEPVDYEGKKPSGFSEGRQTRIAWSIDKHLQYTLQTSIDRVLKEAGSTVVAGIVATAKVQLETAAKALKAEVVLHR